MNLPLQLTELIRYTAAPKKATRENKAVKVDLFQKQNVII